MNGREIERLLTLIDKNIAMNTVARNAEFFRYIETHQAEALDQLQKTGALVVRTSLGEVRASLDELRQAAA